MERVGDYEILGALGAGGMGQVLKVRNVITDRIEAMKVLLPNLVGRQELVDRFLREIKVLAALDHPNIAALRTAFTYNDRLVMVMEFVDGTTLAAMLERGPIAAADAVHYVDQVLQALSYAHSRNVVHRDIKPANIMLTPQGVVKLMDFGIARSAKDRSLTATGTTLGSLYYMSPEQVKGEDVDARSDLYSVGVSLYEMVTGQRPFDASSDFSILSAHLQQPPRPPIELRSDIPQALNQIILLALAKNPDGRFQTADAFRNALSSIALPVAAVANAVAAPAPSPGPAVAAPSASVAASATALMQGHPAAATATTAPVAAPAVEQAQPAPNPYVPGVESATNRRGMWMAIGGLMVLGILIASAIYLPRRSHTLAGAVTAVTTTPTPTPAQTSESLSSPSSPSGLSSGASTVSPTQPPSTPAAPETAAPAESQVTPTTSPAVSANASTATGARPVKTSSFSEMGKAFGVPRKAPANVKGSAAADTASSSASASTASSAEIDDLEHEIDLLTARASSVTESLNHMRQQQAAQGLSLRGDMASAQDRMTNYLERANHALHQRDVSGARKYLGQAEAEVDRLEKFLGR